MKKSYNRKKPNLQDAQNHGPIKVYRSMPKPINIFLTLATVFIYFLYSSKTQNLTYCK